MRFKISKQLPHAATFEMAAACKMLTRAVLVAAGHLSDADKEKIDATLDSGADMMSLSLVMDGDSITMAIASSAQGKKNTMEEQIKKMSKVHIDIETPPKKNATG